MLSKRSHLDLRENPIARRLRELHSSGASLLDLTVSSPAEAGLEHHEDLLLALSTPEGMRYAPEAQGLRIAREAIAAELRDLGQDVAIEDLILTSGTSEAYSYLFKLLCDPGDEVLIPTPSYPLFEQLAKLEGVRTVGYPLAYDGTYHIDLAALRNAVIERTRAIIVVNPNNPTGSYLKQQELHELLSLGVPVISDEVFAFYPLGEDAERAPTVLSANTGLVFALGGLSKAAALPQLKLSYIALGGDKHARAEARNRLTFIADAYLSVATPVQLALPRLLAAGRGLRRAILARLQSNLQLVQERCRPPSPLTARTVEGGFYAAIRLPRVMSDEAWALTLLDDVRVLVQPGYFYDFQEEGMLVLSLLTKPEILTRGLELMHHCVEKHT